MELVRVVSHNTHKRMVSCLQGHIGADAEKRHVRPPTRRDQTDARLALSRENQLRPDRPAGRRRRITCHVLNLHHRHKSLGLTPG